VISRLKTLTPEIGARTSSFPERENDSLALLKGGRTPPASRSVQRLTRQYLRERTLPTLLGEIERDMTQLCPEYVQLAMDVRRFASTKLSIKDHSLVGIVSAHSGEGRTTLALAVAATLAEMHDRVLYVECETQEESTLLDQLAEPEAYGLTEWVSSEASLDDSIVPSRKQSLSILPHGHAYLTASNLEKSVLVRRLFPELRKEFNVTVVDLPPVLSNEAAAALIAEMDQILIVVEADQTEVEDVAELVELCGDIPIAGIFLNKVTQRLPEWLSSILGSKR
jgi:Mrp family chromosome partitioning ATPase